MTAPVAGMDGLVARSAVSEAWLTACALAGWGCPLAGQDIALRQARMVVWSVLRDHTDAEVLAWWRWTEPPQWRLRWRWAVETVRRLFPDLPGMRDLPVDVAGFDDYLGR